MSYISAAQAKQIAQKAVDNLKDGTLVPKLAENLTPFAEDSGTTQTQPFFLEGTATGNGESRVDAKQVPAFAFLQEKRGNMVCVNQLAGENLGGAGGLTITNNSGIYTINGTSSSAGHYLDFVFNCLSGHKYLVIATAKNYPDISDNTHPGIQLYGTGVIAYVYVSDVVRNGTTFLLGTATGSGAAHFRFRTSSDVTYNNTQITPALVDLTQWFNGNIPAYLLSHPEAFGRYYKGSLGAYEPGRLESATGRYFESIGRNIWDEEWESGTIVASTGVKVSDANKIRSKNYISITSSTTYYVKAPSSVVIFQYDAGKNYIGYIEGVANTTFTTDSTCYYIYFVCGSSVSSQTTYNYDITISRYYEGESGYDKYYPYEVLATIDTGTESLYSAGSAYDSKVPSGLITRRIGSVDLGTLNWEYRNNVFYSISFPGYAPSNDPTFVGNLICSIYTTVSRNRLVSADKIVSINKSDTTYLSINDSAYTDAASFKAAMSGVILYYELAESTTEQGTPFQETIPIDDFGQLSWSDTDVPQGNQIFYPVDYKAAIDTLINYTDGDMTSLALKDDITDAALNARGYYKMADILQTIGANGMVGGTLRQQLAQAKSIDFLNTDCVDLGTLTWSYNATNQYFSAVISNIKPAGNNNTLANILCTLYKSETWNNTAPSTVTSMNVAVDGTGRILGIKDTTYNTTDAFKAAMQGVLLAYEKA